jgi:hypothetical protein
MSSPLPPTQYNHYVSMNGDPFIFTTSDSADATCRLCAIQYAEQIQKEKPLSHKTWIKFEQEQVEAVDRYIDESRYIVEWNEVARFATVSRSDRVRDGMIRSGYTTMSELCRFKVGSVPRFISPLKQRTYFEARARDQAEHKAAVEKARAEKALAKMLEAAAATATTAAVVQTPVLPVLPIATAAATGLPAVPSVAPVVVPKPPPLPQTPSFEEVFREFTQ